MILVYHRERVRNWVEKYVGSQMLSTYYTVCS